MSTSMTHRYIPRIEQTEQNLFVEEYYSSTDTKIYMDDIEQTEISYINYSLQEQLKPIYGYASRTFDDMAIGSRIVTGVFKVPIKNPEAQTQMSTIIERSKNSTLQDYNDNQQQLMDAVDWITGQKITADDYIYEDDTTFDYRVKLIKLGYELDYNSSAYVLEQQIKKFQSDYKMLEINGKLTTQTKAKIDEALRSSSYPTFYVLSGTHIYLKPTYSSDSEPIVEGQNVYVLDGSTEKDEWVYVMTKDGTEGYINVAGVQE